MITVVAAKLTLYSENQLKQIVGNEKCGKCGAVCGYPESVRKLLQQKQFGERVEFLCRECAKLVRPDIVADADKIMDGRKNQP